MKNLILLSFSLFVGHVASSQSDSISHTRLRVFSNRQSTLIHRVSYEISQSGPVEVRLMTIKDLTTEEVIKGVTIGWNNNGLGIVIIPVATQYGCIKENGVFIDSDEIHGLIQALTKMVTMFKANIRENSYQYSFETRDGFVVRLYSELNGKYNASLENDNSKAVYAKPEVLEQILQSLIICRDRIK